MTEEQEKRIKDKIKFVQDTLYVISGKWKLPIIHSMAKWGEEHRIKVTGKE